MEIGPRWGGDGDAGQWLSPLLRADHLKGDSFRALQRAFHKTAPGRRVLTGEMSPIKRSGNEAQMIEHVTRLHVRIDALCEGVIDPIMEPASPEGAPGRGANASERFQAGENGIPQAP